MIGRLTQMLVIVSAAQYIPYGPISYFVHVALRLPHNDERQETVGVPHSPGFTYFCFQWMQKNKVKSMSLGRIEDGRLWFKYMRHEEQSVVYLLASRVVPFSIHGEMLFAYYTIVKSSMVY